MRMHIINRRFLFARSERLRLEFFDFDSLRLIIEGLYQTYDQQPVEGAGPIDLCG